MEIFNTLTKLNNVSLALGFFDGVHKGHKKVIETAKVENTKLAVVTFKQHPMEIFGFNCKYICSQNKRAQLMEEIGVDFLFELDFTRDLSNMTGEDYLKMLIETFRPKSITTGFNHTFGVNKSGTPELLAKRQDEYSYVYKQVPPQKYENEIISSTLIKKYLKEGNLTKVNNMLGYNFSIEGKVIHGNHIGKTIGYPTANVEYPDRIEKLPFGVYYSKVDNKKAVTNYGEKPTVGQNTPIVETHIIDFNKDIYNNIIEIEFIKKIRDEKKFNSLEELKKQINKDTKTCSKL